MSIKAWLAIAAYIATIFIANWLVSTFGIVPIGFGLSAPAGVFAVGAALSLRDIAQEEAGSGWVMAAIIAGALLSAIISPTLALASGSAFLFSETADFIVYTPLRKHNWLWAVALSNTVGLIADSLIFLYLAFGSLSYLSGQIIGKLEISMATVAVLWMWKRTHKQEEVAA